MQLARAVRNRTTGVLYVMDEPSIGLHPSNIKGLTGVMNDLVADGNSIILVDHDTQILKESDWIVEMGPQAGAAGGYVIAQGTTDSIVRDPASQIGSFLSGEAESRIRDVMDPASMFEEGTIHLATGSIHTVNLWWIDIPKGRLWRSAVYRFGKNHHGSGKSGVQRRAELGEDFAGACEGASRRQDRSCQADRCDAGRYQRPFYGGHLCRSAR